MYWVIEAVSHGNMSHLQAQKMKKVKEKVEFWEEVKNNLWALLILIMQVWKNIS